jgi:DMSO/TMAO reductase YedYZ molybdopterin-dependent catalytic subunit
MVKMKQERSLQELYADDPERADALAFGRRTDASRRGFLQGAGLTAMGAVVGASIPFHQNMPAGLIPAAFAQTPAPAATEKKEEPAGPKYLEFPGKDGKLVLLGDKPLVAETPEFLLDDDTTPFSKFFIRHNGTPPEEFKDADTWTLKIEGEVDKPVEIKLGELKSKFKAQTYRMVMECGGNGRSFYSPPARGNQWTNGGAGCAEWTGVRLKDVLESAGLKSTAVYTAHYGTDKHLSGEDRPTLSRGVPISKAMEEHTLLAWGMNGEPLPNVHGGPLRLVASGYPASASHKWLNRLVIRDVVHDGPGMKGWSYRVPIKPMIPGDKGDEANAKVMEFMPTRSIVTNPANGTKLAAGTRKLPVRGAAWAGERQVTAVDLSIDFGQTWTPVKLAAQKNRFDWNRFTAELAFPSDGYFEIWARATDSTGAMQPLVAPNWNPQGYGGNPINRIAVLIG